jgi:hypothetical protein
VRRSSAGSRIGKGSDNARRVEEGGVGFADRGDYQRSIKEVISLLATGFGDEHAPVASRPMERALVLIVVRPML